MIYRTREILHASTELRIISEPVYDLVIWALTLGSVVAAICEWGMLLWLATDTWFYKFFVRLFHMATQVLLVFFLIFKNPCGLRVYCVSIFRVTTNYIKHKLAIPEITLGQNATLTSILSFIQCYYPRRVVVQFFSFLDTLRLTTFFLPIHSHL